MPLEDSAAIAPYDDGSSTESECYDEELLEFATNNTPTPQPNVPTDVKVEIRNGDASANASECEDPKVKAKPTYNRCKRCRRKLPVVSEKEKAELQQGKLRTKRCACCCEDYPLSKFGMANRTPQRAIPRCRSCSQAPPEVLHKLRSNPQYAEALAVERQTLKEQRKGKRVELPPFERKSVKQRWDEQFQLVGGKTARERRRENREAERKSRLACIRSKQKQS
ncbi:hypothetical protein PRNP1_012027 [Phytophthora ramorum]